MAEPPDTSKRASDTLLGQAPARAGPWFLDALAAPRAEAVECLLKRVRDDPRWDGQVVSRDEQYGELAVALEVPIEPLDEVLRTTPGDRDDAPHSLVLDVLLQMLRRGLVEAGEVLREYVAYGAEVSHVIYQLHDHAPELHRGIG